MNFKRIKKSLLLCLCIVIIAAMSLLTTGCSDNKDTSTDHSGHNHSSVTQDISSAISEAVTQLGEGQKCFAVSVVDTNGTETKYEIRTDAENVGEALTQIGFIDGEEGPYGLYVKTVDCLTVDYDKDGKYWAFYINGEYATQGVDKTPIDETAVYTFKVE
ncbi:MAG: DUF4430 domain-containing protein [Clostridia bacterium]|nr:DUF4430 domain-containing protein [Clostridia bacterium]